MIECFKQIKFQAAVLQALDEKQMNGRTRYVIKVSKEQRRNIRTMLVRPTALMKWASTFHVSKETIMERISEIGHEKPSIGRIVAFVRRF